MNYKVSELSNERWYKAVEYLLSRYGHNVEEHLPTLKKLRARLVPSHLAVSMIVGTRPFPWENETSEIKTKDLETYLIPFLDEA